MPSFFRTFLLMLTLTTVSEAAETVRVGAVAFGTLNWELATVQRLGLDQANGIDVQTHTLTSPQAGSVALQAGGVDIAVSDWIWVSRQRENGADFTFVPYSASHGVLVVPPGSSMTSVADLAGKRLGVAGGGLDKNWLLLRALAKEKHGLDLEKSAEIVFGAPPLLNEQLQQGHLDALMDYWHYAAKLQAKGYKALVTGQDLMRELGVQTTVPSLGYVFRDSWARQHRPTIEGFLAATREAKRLLCEADEAWEQVRPLTQETDAAVLANLRRDYCAGQVQRFGEAERQGAAAIYRLLKHAGGSEAAGAAADLAPGTFWPGAEH